MYYNSTVLTVVPIGPRCDPALVKVDERKKLYLATQPLFTTTTCRGKEREFGNHEGRFTCAKRSNIS